MQVDEDYDDRVQDWPDDDSEDSDYTHAAEKLAEDATSDGDLDDVEEQDCDELLEEIREQTGTINSPTRCCSLAMHRQSMSLPDVYPYLVCACS